MAATTLQMMLPADEMLALLFFVDSEGLRALRAASRPYRHLITSCPELWRAIVLKRLPNLQPLQSIDAHSRDWEAQLRTWETDAFRWLRVPCGGESSCSDQGRLSKRISRADSFLLLLLCIGDH